MRKKQLATFACILTLFLIGYESFIISRSLDFSQYFSSGIIKPIYGFIAMLLTIIPIYITIYKTTNSKNIKKKSYQIVYMFIILLILFTLDLLLFKQPLMSIFAFVLGFGLGIPLSNSISLVLVPLIIILVFVEHRYS